MKKAPDQFHTLIFQNLREFLPHVQIDHLGYRFDYLHHYWSLLMQNSQPKKFCKYIFNINFTKFASSSEFLLSRSY